MEREEVRFHSDDAACAAWHYHAPEAGAPRACVVMAHGFGGVRRARLDTYAERFAAAGLDVLVFDYRHFGDSEGEPRQLLDVGRQLADWQAAIAHARTHPEVDPDRVAIWGTSFSGGHVLRLAARDNRLAAAVAQVPFVDGLATAAATGPAALSRLTVAATRDALRGARGQDPVYVPLVGPPGSLAAMTTPDAEPGYRALMPDDVDDRVAARILLRVPTYRPGTVADRISCPLLVCVAGQDSLTPPRPAVRAARRAPRGQLCAHPHAGHFDLYFGEEFERTVDQQTAFLQQHLLPSRGG